MSDRKEPGYWTEAEDNRLRKLWAEGRSCRAIAEVIGRTHNSIIGRARRIGVEPRTNPIGMGHHPNRPKSPKRPRKRPQTPAIPHAVRQAAVSLPPLMSGALIPTIQAPLKRQAHFDREGMSPQVTTPPNGSTVFRMPPPGACCWPYGEPKSSRFHYCEGPAVFMKPYCEAHCEVAYTNWGQVRAAVVW